MTSRATSSALPFLLRSAAASSVSTASARAAAAIRTPSATDTSRPWRHQIKRGTNNPFWRDCGQETPKDARDAVQDAFVSAFKSIKKFEAGSSLSTWLHRIVINASLMKLRARRRRPEEEIDRLLPRFQQDGHQVEPTTPWAVSAEQMVQRVQTAELVRKLIDRLPETYRLVLIMRDLEEMTTEETAQALGVSTNAVKVRLHRARQALRTLLDPHMKELAP